MVLKEVFTYNLDGDSDELHRDVEIENSSDAAIFAVEAPIPPKKLHWMQKRWREVKGKHRARLVPRVRPHR